MKVEYFWAGQMGPVMAQNFPVGYDDDFLLRDEIVGSAVVFSPCGQDVIFRINSNIEARKQQRNSAEEVEISIDTTDVEVTGFNRPFFTCYLQVQVCS